MENETLKSEKKRACRSLMKTDRMHRRAFEKMVLSLGVHRSQHILLMNIARQGENISQKQLSKRLEISEAAVAVSLRRLAASGLIEKKSAEKDCRYNEVSITERGRRIVEESERLFSELDCAMCEGIGEEELEIFIRCLQRMRENLERFNSEWDSKHEGEPSADKDR